MHESSQPAQRDTPMSPVILPSMGPSVVAEPPVAAGAAPSNKVGAAPPSESASEPSASHDPLAEDPSAQLADRFVATLFSALQTSSAAQATVRTEQLED